MDLWLRLTQITSEEWRTTWLSFSKIEKNSQLDVSLVQMATFGFIHLIVISWK
mgnify:CR=1 FL=1